MSFLPRSMSSGTHMSDEYFDEVMKSGAFSDFKVTCQGTEFRVHKILLSSACEFFRKMLKHECWETRDGVVDLPDEDPDIVAIMLKFIYTDRCSPNDVVDMDDSKALEFSNVYGEPSEAKKSFMEEYHRLGIERALKFVKIYQTADKYALRRLQDFARYVTTNRPLFNEHGWLQYMFIVQHPDFPALIEEIMLQTGPYDDKLRAYTIDEVADYVHFTKDAMGPVLAELMVSYEPEAFRLALESVEARRRNRTSGLFRQYPTA